MQSGQSRCETGIRVRSRNPSDALPARPANKVKVIGSEARCPGCLLEGATPRHAAITEAAFRICTEEVLCHNNGWHGCFSVVFFSFYTNGLS
jgi:hypothetical protein